MCEQRDQPDLDPMTKATEVLNIMGIHGYPLYLIPLSPWSLDLDPVDLAVHTLLTDTITIAIIATITYQLLNVIVRGI